MEETKKYEPLRLKPCLRSYLLGRHAPARGVS